MMSFLRVCTRRHQCSCFCSGPCVCLHISGIGMVRQVHDMIVCGLFVVFLGFLLSLQLLSIVFLFSADDAGPSAVAGVLCFIAHHAE